jgi:hypothetical protein
MHLAAGFGLCFAAAAAVLAAAHGGRHLTDGPAVAAIFLAALAFGLCALAAAAAGIAARFGRGSGAGSGTGRFVALWWRVLLPLAALSLGLLLVLEMTAPSL